MAKPSVIAHRGASGYLPEHTQESKVLAHAMGADFLEQDVIASRDGVLIVLHDIYLDAVTDVALRYPNRARDDGHFYAIDFDYAEIQALSVHERSNGSNDGPLFPGRFPRELGQFKVASLEAEIELVQGLNSTTGRGAGIYPEIKDPAWHHQHGIDLARSMLTLLQASGYSSASEQIFLQCFDATELRRVRNELGASIQLVQLLGREDDHSESALRKISTYADGIGPSYFDLIEVTNTGIKPSALCSIAHDLGLVVHPYTFRRDQLPPFATSFPELLQFFMAEVGVDGLFTDFTDIAVGVRDRLNLD